MSQNKKGNLNPVPGTQTNAKNKSEGQVAVDGFQQVLDMLKMADPSFRESLLKRLAARDGQLARDLRRDLGI